MKSKKNLTRFTYESAAFEGWRLNISRAGSSFTRYFPDKALGGPRKSLKAAEATLEELKALLEGSRRVDGKLDRHHHPQGGETAQGCGVRAAEGWRWSIRNDGRSYSITTARPASVSGARPSGRSGRNPGHSADLIPLFVSDAAQPACLNHSNSRIVHR